MYNFLKMFLAIGIVKKYKRNLISIVVSIIVMYIATYFIEDILKIAEKQDKLLLYFTKWSILFICILFILYNFYSMFKTKSKSKKNNTLEIDFQKPKKTNKNIKGSKKYLLKTNSLETKGEAIIKKYKKG
jgi:UDP-N-acetylmuramyl pentapeptide phosphotransferase/UDP-N-acetylglucosamine-1-phosphate transferase